MAKHTTDDELIEAASQGNRTAFALLVQRHRDWVHRLIVKIVQDHHNAEDLTQEVFFQVHSHLVNYKAQGKFVAWLKRIAVNRARNFLRDHRRRPQILHAPLEAVELEDKRFDPQVVLSSQLLQQEIRTALNTLNPDQQQVIVLYYFAGMGIEAIAEALNCSAGTVKSRLYYGRHHLHKRLRTTFDSLENHEKGLEPHEG